MIVFPEWDWGIDLALVPVSLLLLGYSALARRGPDRRHWRFAALCLVLFAVTTHLLFQFGSLGKDFYQSARPFFFGNIVLIALMSVVVTLALFAFAQAATLAPKPGRTATLILVIGFLAASISTFMKVSYGGWGIIISVGTGMVYALAVFHCTQRFAIFLRPQVVGVTLPVFADLLFLLAALFRMDMDDSSSYTVIESLSQQLIGLAAPPFGAWMYGAGHPWVNGLVHVPLVGAWLWIEVTLRRGSRT